VGERDGGDGDLAGFQDDGDENGDLFPSCETDEECRLPDLKTNWCWGGICVECKSSADCLSSDEDAGLSDEDAGLSGEVPVCRGGKCELWNATES
jgi:hypothetical protein